MGIDFGTSSIKVYDNHKGLVLDEKNIIAIYKKKDVLAIGNRAFEMYEKTPEDIDVTYPIKNGVIADIGNMKVLVKGFMDSLASSGHHVKGAEYYLAVPTDITEVETRAYRTLVAEAKLKAKKIYLVNKPVANLKGMGAEVGKEKGLMVVDVGANTSEITVMSLGGMVVSKLLPMGGGRLDEAVISMVRREQNYIIGAKTAEWVKKETASAVPLKKAVRVYGRNLATGLPDKITIEADDVYYTIRGYMEQLLEAVQSMLERTPHEIMEGVRKSGIWLTGGSSQINGMREFLADAVKLPVHLCENPENTVILGLGAIMKDPKEFRGEVSWEERRR